MPVTKSTFDKADDITLYTLTNATNRLTVQIADYGSTIVSISVPDRDNVPRDVVLGFDDLDGYQSKVLRNPYFGATIGRIANRIGDASFELDGKQYRLNANSGSLNLHGGPQGFDKRKWSLVAEDDYSITLQYISADLEMGFPGALKVQIQFSVTDENELRIEYSAKLLDEPTTTKTIVNLTNHSYFNLNGASCEDASKILDHLMLMQANDYLEVDQSLVPSGRILPVSGTLLDFTRNAHEIGERTHEVKPNGYDHCFVLQKQADKFNIAPEEIKKAVEVWSPHTGIKMTMSTTEPAFQFYAGSKIADGHKPKKSQSADASFHLGSYSGFCLEASRFPDAINKEQWNKQVILSGGEQYKQVTMYKFETTEQI